MAVYKCKMCGGTIEVKEGQNVVTCEFCGTTQTVHSFDNEKKNTFFKRADALRYKCEFDKAAGVYETIVTEFPKEAEAYWGLVLCKYGIEYVDDPKTGNKIPTCHRTRFESIYDDSDYINVVKYADVVAKEVYEKEAKEISKLQKAILDISSKEDPFDIFICYKETDASGERTPDSVLAQDIYKELTNDGYRVFFSRITLEDKLGSQYEPYIFAALHSSKVMLHVTTSFENSDSIWVRNEWSRYLSLIQEGQKKVLIPCYKKISPYDLPEEMQRLQGQDMSKIGSMQDLVRAIGKIVKINGDGNSKIVRKEFNPKETLFEEETAKGEVYLNIGNYKKAEEHFEEAIKINSKGVKAYIGLLLAKTQSDTVKHFIDNLDRFYSEIFVNDLIEILEKKVIEPEYQDSKELNEILKAVNDKKNAEITKKIDKYISEFKYEVAHTIANRNQASSLFYDRLLTLNVDVVENGERLAIKDLKWLLDIRKIFVNCDDESLSAKKDHVIKTIDNKIEKIAGKSLSNYKKVFDAFLIEALEPTHSDLKCVLSLLESLQNEENSFKQIYQTYKQKLSDTTYLTIKELISKKRINFSETKYIKDFRHFILENNRQEEIDDYLRKCKKKKRIIAITASAVTVVSIAIAVVVSITVSYFNKIEERYNEALQKMEEADYLYARGLLEILPSDYKNSRSLINACSLLYDWKNYSGDIANDYLESAINDTLKTYSKKGLDIKQEYFFYSYDKYNPYYTERVYSSFTIHKFEEKPGYSLAIIKMGSPYFNRNNHLTITFYSNGYEKN